jgi:hypothetical protein
MYSGICLPFDGHNDHAHTSRTSNIAYTHHHPHNIRVTMTMACRYWHYQIVSLLFAWSAAAPATAAEDNNAFCNCQYTIPADWEPRCRVFGHVATHNEDTAGDSHQPQLVAFERANQSCIDQLSLAEADGGSLTYSNEEMWAMCPFANGTNTNVQLAMNELQYGGDKSTAVRTIQSLLQSALACWSSKIVSTTPGPVPWTAKPPHATAGRPFGSLSPSTRRYGASCANSFISNINWTMPSNNGEHGCNCARERRYR